MFLTFPSKESIVSYLKKHPDTKNLSEKKIIPLIADAFKNSRIDSETMGKTVMEPIRVWNKETNLTEYALIPIIMNLTKALKDCAIPEKS